MDLRAKLSKRIGMTDIKEMLCLILQNKNQKQELYDLVLDKDEKIGYQAAWIFTHFSSQDNKWLFNKQNQLIDEVLICKHGGKRRLLLNLLNKQPLASPPRTDFLDFCLERVAPGKELPGVQSICIKIAYKLCRPIPELLQELKIILDMMDNNQTPAIRSVRKNILKAIEKDKNSSL